MPQLRRDEGGPGEKEKGGSVSTPAFNAFIYDGYGWILFDFSREKNRWFAHKAAAGPCGTRFIPMFKTRTAAIEYRDKRLQMPKLKAQRARIEFA